jgi:hypothetical protein
VQKHEIHIKFCLEYSSDNFVNLNENESHISVDVR